MKVDLAMGPHGTAAAGVRDLPTPHVIVAAGPNGAGKSTAAPWLLRNTLPVAEFVNADAIAGGLSALQPETWRSRWFASS